MINDPQLRKSDPSIEKRVLAIAKLYFVMSSLKINIVFAVIYVTIE